MKDRDQSLGLVLAGAIIGLMMWSVTGVLWWVLICAILIPILITTLLDASGQSSVLQASEQPERVKNSLQTPDQDKKEPFLDAAGVRAILPAALIIVLVGLVIWVVIAASLLG